MKKQNIAIYYKKQEQKYADYEKKIDELNLRKEFNEFKSNYKGAYKNKVYYYFFKGLEK